MEKGLIWVPLLAVFTWLAWQGRNEYQKVEAYRNWAEQFERAKYDIYAVLGQKENNVTWGKPTREGPIQLQTFSLKDVKSLHLVVDGQSVSLKTPPAKGQAIALEFLFPEPTTSVSVPFTEIPLAVEWGNHLQQEWQRLHSESTDTDLNDL